ncbi:uracil-DNA glycosylase [Patulibacter americanus]|uniref:uracil-DNA glycosylase n=1 Tax=Patulibacter americanus TaxID=588672 RepID=UPI0003B595CC|nr:uracil-DNA glycosylase [Patulibacter americanus]
MPATAIAASAAERRTRLLELQDRSRGCVRCSALAANRTTVVFGAGDPDADVLFVGESPGPNEDRQGVPFVGAPARLLNELLAEVGLRREDVYVTTALKCRPPSNRDPLAEELANCRPYLDDQVALVRPKVVVTLGNFATKLLREDPASIKAVRGRVEVRTVGGRAVRLLPVHHPAAALYQRSHIELLRQDLALLPALLALPEPPQPAPEPVVPEPAAGSADAADATPGGAGRATGGPRPADADAGGEGDGRDDDAPASGQLGLF